MVIKINQKQLQIKRKQFQVAKDKMNHKHRDFSGKDQKLYQNQMQQQKKLLNSINLKIKSQSYLIFTI